MKILTKEDKDVVVRLQQHTMNVFKRKVLSLIWAPILFFIVSILVDMFYCGVAVIIVYLIFLLGLPYINKKSMDKINEENKIMLENKVVEYTFEENEFIVKAYQNDEQISMNKYKYEQLVKIEETEKDFYMYIYTNMALVIVKEDIDNNDMNELRGLLQSKNPRYLIFENGRKLK